MPNSIQDILADNVRRVRERIAQAAEKSGRSAEDVQLVAVTKYVDVETTAALLSTGCDTLGESRPQQLKLKAAAPELESARWHLIGHLQRNKIRASLPHLEMIHSVDSRRLLEAINRIAQELACQSRILLEVNCSGDDEKHGMTADELARLLPELPQFENVEVCGLMTMAAREGGESVAAQNFEQLREIRDQAQENCPASVQLRELSMGMSHDFEVAIQQGATIVRIGSLLFEGIS